MTLTKFFITIILDRFCCCKELKYHQTMFLICQFLNIFVLCYDHIILFHECTFTFFFNFDYLVITLNLSSIILRLTIPNWNHLAWLYVKTAMSLTLPENTHLLRMGKYHCTADLLFDRLRFGQTSKSVNSFNSTKQQSRYLDRHVRCKFSRHCTYWLIKCLKSSAAKFRQIHLAIINYCK